MKITEVIPKNTKPLTPQQMLIRNLKQNVENSKKKLRLEKERQNKAKEIKRLEKIRKYG
jgi:predicted alpha/beta-fold hydrolase